jgi:hypothetical protein
LFLLNLKNLKYFGEQAPNSSPTRAVSQIRSSAKSFDSTSLLNVFKEKSVKISFLSNFLALVFGGLFDLQNQRTDSETNKIKVAIPKIKVFFALNPPFGTSCFFGSI